MGHYFSKKNAGVAEQDRIGNINRSHPISEPAHQNMGPKQSLNISAVPSSATTSIAPLPATISATHSSSMLPSATTSSTSTDDAGGKFSSEKSAKRKCSETDYQQKSKVLKHSESLIRIDQDSRTKFVEQMQKVNESTLSSDSSTDCSPKIVKVDKTTMTDFYEQSRDNLCSNMPKGNNMTNACNHLACNMANSYQQLYKNYFDYLHYQNRRTSSSFGYFTWRSSLENYNT